MKKYLLSVAVALCTLYCYSCKSVANFPIDAPSPQTLDDRIVGKWKFEEDTNKANFYEVYKSKSPDHVNEYHVRFWNRGGTNPTYEGNAYFSWVGNSLFLNVPYWESGFTNKGYFFLKVLDKNQAFDKMTTATVHDENMRSLKNEIEVRKHIMQHLNDPSFYYDTVHFYKMK